MRFAKTHSPSQEDTRKVKTQTTSRTVEVRADGEGLVSHAGAFLLVELADRVKLTSALSEAMAPSRERRSAHDPGVVLRDLAVAIADGGDHVSDLGVLRGQQALFGAVASGTTAHRVLKSIDAGLLDIKGPVDSAAMIKAGLMRRAKAGVKLLGEGEFKAKVEFAVWGASKSAREAIEKAGGSLKILAPAAEAAPKAKGKKTKKNAGKGE